jgi:nitrate reductase gamma subunit
MKIVWPLVGVGGLGLLAFLGGSETGLRPLLAVAVPYVAVLIFLTGVVARVVIWGRSPVPFRIPTSCGQQRSLPWIKTARFDNPSTGWAAAGRMAMEVLLFRSLFRNVRSEARRDGKVVHFTTKYLWAGALAFHVSLLLILIRHFRYFAEPVPGFVGSLQSIDGFFQIGLPIVYVTDAVLVAAVAFLLLRRLVDPRLRYLSIFGDYFPVFLILAIAGSGIALRYFFRVDVVAVKEMMMGLVTFRPVNPEGIHPFFFVHLLLVCVLVAYFPFSKLIHMAGIFLSPTRNLANNNRRRRHVNPWNPAITGHTYARWEEEFEDKLRAAEIPLDRE